MKSKRITWSLQLWNIAYLKPYDKNPRIISDIGLDILGQSFDEIGFCQPVNINTDGTILSGHARWMQLQREGAATVECYVPDRLLTPKQEEAVIIRMNKNTAGAWDFEKLNDLFEKDDLIEWGFTDQELSFDVKKIDDHEIDIAELEDKYLIVVTCKDELEQNDLFEEFKTRELNCKIMS